jgi:hypothetical protein
MHIMHLAIADYSDLEGMESEICRLLRCSSGKCAAMHTESFIHFRASLLTATAPRLRNEVVHLPEGLTLQLTPSGVDFFWTYAVVEQPQDTTSREQPQDTTSREQPQDTTSREQPQDTTSREQVENKSRTSREQVENKG